MIYYLDNVTCDYNGRRVAVGQIIQNDVYSCTRRMCTPWGIDNLKLPNCKFNYNDSIDTRWLSAKKVS